MGERLKWVRRYRLRVGDHGFARALTAAGYVPVKGEKLSHTTVKRYERGVEGSPNPDYLVAVIRASGISGHWLLTGEGSPMPPELEGAQVAFEIIAGVVDEFRSPAETSDDKRSRAERLAERLRRLAG